MRDALGTKSTGANFRGGVELARKLESGARAVAQWGRDVRVRRVIFGVALAAFAGGLFVAIARLPTDLGLERLDFIVLLLLVGVPLTVSSNALETKLTARALGVRFSWPHSLRVAILASAANMLPLPGGPMVRVGALRVGGADLTRSGTAMLLAATIWIGVAATLAGACLLGVRPMWGAAFLIGGLLALVSGSWLYYGLCASLAMVCAVVAARCAAVSIGVIRMSWALAALGVAPRVSEVSIFALSNVLGSAVSIVPAGLGVVEGGAALLARLTEIPPSAAFLAASVNRVLTLSVVIVAALTVSRGMLRSSERGAQNAE